MSFRLFPFILNPARYHYLWRTYATVSNVKISSDKKTLAVEFDGKERHVYHAVWLKHLCHCPKCRDPSSGQTQFSPETLRGTYRLSRAFAMGDILQVSWEDDEDEDHQGTFPAKWLREMVYGEDVLNKMAATARPIPLVGKVSEFDYRSLTKSESERLNWLIRIYEDGFSLVKNVPIEPGYVTKMADFVFSKVSTFHGDYFNVVAQKDGVSVAHAEKPLFYHMDEAFYESPPGLLLLHCLRNDKCVEGGVNVMVDQLVAAEEFRRVHPQEFDILAKIPIAMGRIYDKLRRPVHALYYRRHFVLGHNEEIVGVNWNYTHQLNVCAPHHMIEAYYQAHSLWATYLENFRIRHRVRLNPGDMLALNNRRMLHSRTNLSLRGGQRHLQGAYVNIDEFKSEVLAQCMQQERPLPKARVGNQDYVC